MSLPLVLLPGLDGTGQLFAPFIRAIPESLEPRVITFPRDRVLGYEDLLSLVERQLPAGQPFILVGESFSGPLALMLAAKQPSGLVGLVLVASFHRRPVSPSKAALQPLLPMALRLPLSALAVRSLLAGWDASTSLVSAFRAAIATVEPGVLAARIGAALAVDATRELAGCRVPLLYLGGVRDRLLRRGIPDELRAVRPDAEVHLLAAPHLVLQRQPSQAAGALVDFVGRLGSRPGAGPAAR